MNKIRKELTVSLLALGTVLAFTSVTAQTQNSNVGVTVNDTVQLDVKPDRLDYTNAGPSGTNLQPGEQRETSDRGFSHIDISNIGSDKIDNIYAEATVNQDQAFGTSPNNQVNHNTGNFVLMSTEQAYAEDYRVTNSSRGGGGVPEVSSPHYLNRVEYFEDQPPEYIQTEPSDGSTDFNVDIGTNSGTSVSNNINTLDVGRFRVGELNYYFTYIEDDASGYYLLVGNTPETPTDLGTFDFTNDNEADYTVIGLDNSVGASGVSVHRTAFSLASFNASQYDSNDPILDGSGGLVDFSAQTSLSSSDVEERAYNLYVDRSTSGEELVGRTKFNVGFESPTGVDTGGITTDGSQEYILNAGTNTEALQPGENFPVNFGVQVPNGVDSTAIADGSVTFNAEAYSP